ncbi:pentraxin fusion protein-like [Eleutherodactylus coqui]|uniref:pentraxin fusion protein-like n=1 Tax=Eleutherodactylus coqui TaxID=57060 RepID=UPI003462AC77
MARAPVCAVIVLLSIWGLNHGGGASSPPKTENYAQPAPNVALNGISTQSSTNSYFGNAQNAIDGSMAANYLRSQCSYTKKESEPWWMVDLKAPHRVMSVAITNRVLECCRERLFGAEIRIGNNPSNGGKLNARCGVISSIESGETLSFSCKGMVGQYVTVTIPGREEHLVMCEVQVFGFPVDGSEDVAVPKDLKTPNGAPNVAPKGIAQQSSLYNMYGEPKNAIDGSLDSNYLYIQCAGTSEQKDPWWMVDLKSKYKIFTVAITNRGDCCAEKINGGEIRIGNSGEKGGTKNPICGVITSMGNGQTLAFECDGMVGQYVTIHIPGAERSLTICEVQVFGLPSDDADVQGPTGGGKSFVILYP